MNTPPRPIQYGVFERQSTSGQIPYSRVAGPYATAAEAHTKAAELGGRSNVYVARTE